MNSESGTPTTLDLPAGIASDNQNTLRIQFSTVKMQKLLAPYSQAAPFSTFKTQVSIRVGVL